MIRLGCDDEFFYKSVEKTTIVSALAVVVKNKENAEGGMLSG